MSKPFTHQPQSHAAMVTSDQVRAEHDAALLSLTPEQRRAINRLQQAKQRSSFNGRFPDENLRTIFEREAQDRTRASDEQERELDGSAEVPERRGGVTPPSST